jgi:hypothetical protein
MVTQYAKEQMSHHSAGKGNGRNRTLVRRVGVLVAIDESQHGRHRPDDSIEIAVREQTCSTGNHRPRAFPSPLGHLRQRNRVDQSDVSFLVHAILMRRRDRGLVDSLFVIHSAGVLRHQKEGNISHNIKKRSAAKHWAGQLPPAGQPCIISCSSGSQSDLGEASERTILVLCMPARIFREVDRPWYLLCTPIPLEREGGTAFCRRDTHPIRRRR